jgi:predicted ribosome quality control (RQC) complex YloA/Tae2 family protein
MGELITANIWQIQKGMDKVKVTNYYDENGSETTILLDKQLTPAQNAQKYYKKYAKQKRTITALTEQKIDVENKLDYLKTITTAIETADRLDDFTEVEEELILLELIKPQDDGKKKKKQALPPYREYFFDDFKIIAGRNNIQNERLTKNLNTDDIWLHTQKYHSTHVGIVTNGRKVPDKVLEIAAEICAYYSDGKEGKKIPVDYTLKKYVKKPPKSNTGFVIYTDYKTVLVDPDPHYEAQV